MFGKPVPLRLHHGAWRPALQVGGAALILVFAHLWLIAPVLQNGDGAIYAEQIEHGDLSVRTTHVGYMLAGIIANKLLAFDTECNLNLMCLAFTSAGAVAAAAIVRRLGGTWTAAVIGCLVTMGLQPYLHGAVLAEVDGVAAALILTAVAHLMYGHPAAAGFAYGYAMLVTPLTSLSLPVLLAAHLGTHRVRNSMPSRHWGLLAFGIAALAVYSPFVFHSWHDYWEGGRGLLHAPRQPWNAEEQVARSIRFFSTTALPWIWLSLIGSILVTRARSIALGTLMATAIAATAGERFLDVPVQLPQLCICAILAVLAIDKISPVDWRIREHICCSCC